MSERPAWIKCHPRCKGWFVGETEDERGAMIMRCDECARFEWDDDAAKLPEAQRALAAYLVPRKRHHTRAVLRELRAAALREHALILALSDVRAWTESQTAIDVVYNIRKVAREALGLD